MKPGNIPCGSSARPENSQESGFSLIELLSVIAIISILASIALPEYASMRVAAFDSATKSDLAKLAVAQDSYHNENNSFTTNTASLARHGFAKTSNISITITTATADAWTAEAVHSNSSHIFSWISSAGGPQW